MAYMMIFNPNQTSLASAADKGTKLATSLRQKYQMYVDLHQYCGCEEQHNLHFILTELENMPNFQKETVVSSIVSSCLIPR